MDTNELIKSLAPHVDWSLIYGETDLSEIPQPMASEKLLEDEFHETEADLGAWSKWKKTYIPEEFEVFPPIVFVDGRLKTHARIIFNDRSYGLLGEVIAGGIVLKGKRLSVDFSEKNPPEIKRIFVLPPMIMETAIKNGVTQKPFKLRIPSAKKELEFYLSSSSLNAPPQQQAYQCLLDEMRELERKVVNSYYDSGEYFVVKDGNLHLMDKPFSEELGPVGLIKRIHTEELPPEFFTEFIYKLEKGERTPFFSCYIVENNTRVKVISYIRIARGSKYEHPLRGIIKVELLKERESLKDELQRESISRAFDMLSQILPSIAAITPIPRTPENIFPIISLEEMLGNFFLPTEMVKTFFERWARKWI